MLFYCWNGHLLVAEGLPCSKCAALARNAMLRAKQECEDCHTAEGYRCACVDCPCGLGVHSGFCL